MNSTLYVPPSTHLPKQEKHSLRASNNHTTTHIQAKPPTHNPTPHLNGRHPQHGAMRRLLQRLRLPSRHLQLHRRLPVNLRATGLHNYFRIRGLRNLSRS